MLKNNLHYHTAILQRKSEDLEKAYQRIARWVNEKFMTFRLTFKEHRSVGIRGTRILSPYPLKILMALRFFKTTSHLNRLSVRQEILMDALPLMERTNRKCYSTRRLWISVPTNIFVDIDQSSIFLLDNKIGRKKTKTGLFQQIGTHIYG